MKVSKIKVNGITNPVGYVMDNVRVSWLVSETEAFSIVETHILVAADSMFKNIAAQKSGAHLDPAGEALDMELLPRTRYYIRIHVTGNNGETAVNEAQAYFETGKIDEPWVGRWIRPREGDDFHPVFRKNFTASKPVVFGRLYISGLGLYTASVNNVPVSRELLTPYYSDYRTEVQYQTYDITKLLKEENEIRVALGNGWYKGHFGLAGKDKNFGSTFQMIAELHLCYEDGTEDVIGSDESWMYQGSDTRDSDIYNGEIVDHLMWEGQENPWKKAEPARWDKKLTERYSLPVIPHEVMAVQEVIHTPAGETVLDFGQNFAGYAAFYSTFPKGTKIVLDFGEILQNGNFYNANYRRAKSRFVYISDGREEIVSPKFTYFGFRYVRVTKR